MLENKLIGFIGGGNMAEAIIKGLLTGGIQAGSIMVAEPLAARREYLMKSYGVSSSENAVDVASKANIIVLAIKPQMAPGVLTALAPTITTEKLVVSIMAGIPTTTIEGMCAAGTRVVRVMPNTAALIQAAASAICGGSHATGDDLETARAIFTRVGSVAITTEKLMDAVTGLSGSGPAYVFAFIEALSDAGVKNGLARDVSLALSVQTVLGAARMVSETSEHPAILKEKVTSPGGTTIAGLHTLENGRFHGLVMDAVDSATTRSKELSGT